MWGRENQDIMDNFLKCPFCLNASVEAKSGRTSCPECLTEFEIDDRLECIFIDMQNMKLSVNGFVCGYCGLVKGDEDRNCVYCGAELSTTMH